MRGADPRTADSDHYQQQTHVPSVAGRCTLPNEDVALRECTLTLEEWQEAKR